MGVHRFALFDSAIGRCAVVWGPRGICGVQLPEGDARATRRRVLERFVGAREARPTPEISEAVGRMVALLDGEGGELSTIQLDMEGVTSFRRRVYEAARMIPPGQTRSYGELALQIGVPGAARAVGQALGRNPFPIVVPCHRVLAAALKPGGFTATGGVATKLRLLALEGVVLEGAAPEGGREGELTFDPKVG